MSLCVHCNDREATVDWVGEAGVLAHVHGMSVRWCRVCVLEAQIAYAEKLAAHLPELRRQLELELAASPATERRL